MSKLSSRKSFEWKRVTNLDGLPSYKAPLESIGNWIILEKQDVQTESIVISNSFEEIEYRYSSNNHCYPTIQNRSRVGHETKLDYFRDSDLRTYAQNNPQGTILIWSPHMHLSIAAILEFTRMKIPFIAIMDPLADQEEAIKVSKVHHLNLTYLKRAKSNELNQRNALNHYPAVLVVKDGKLCRQVQRGYRKARKYNLILKEMRNEC